MGENEIKNYDDFKAVFFERICQEYGFSGEVTMIGMCCNNSDRKDGICVHNDKRKISPAICVDEYYQAFQEGKNIEELMESFREKNCDENVPEVLGFFDCTDFQEAMEHITMHLVNTEQNQDLLSKTVYHPFFDLSAVYYLILDDENDEIISMPVSNDLMNTWGCDEEILYFHALSNMSSIWPPTLDPLDELLKKIGILNDEDDTEEDREEVLVLSNVLCYYGAAGIMIPDLMMGIAEKMQEDFWVVPSSVHEVLLVPSSLGHTEDILEEMVRTVNETNVAPEDQLGNHVYYYSCKTGFYRDFAD